MNKDIEKTLREVLRARQLSHAKHLVAELLKRLRAGESVKR